MTKEQSKAHWWIVENHPDFRIEPPKKYFEICDIVYNALKQGQLLPIDSVVGQSEQLVCPDCKHNARMQNGFIWCENDDCGGIYRAK